MVASLAMKFWSCGGRARGLSCGFICPFCVGLGGREIGMYTSASAGFFSKSTKYSMGILGVKGVLEKRFQCDESMSGRQQC